MNSLNNQITPFERLPCSMIGSILDQLNKETGSKGIRNESDIPVIMKYVCNLACTSKQMAAKVNNLNTIHIFLKSLSDKYEKSCEHFAALLNTPGARKWLWNYIQKNGDDKSYQVIQDIYELASDVLKEAEQIGLTFERFVKRESRPSPCVYQTQQGFALHIGSSFHYIATPFGKIEVYEGPLFSKSNELSWIFDLSVTEALIKRLNAVFERHTHNTKCEIFEVESFSGDALRKINQEEIKKINVEELENRKGTQNLMVTRANRWANLLFYNIRTVKGSSMPDVIYCNSVESMRSYKLIDRIWEMLEMNQLGIDPIKNKKVHEKTIKQPTVTQEPLFKNISEVSQWGLELVNKLMQQSISPESGWHCMVYKRLVLKDYQEALLLEILNIATEEILENDTSWPIYTFYSDHIPPFRGIELRLREENKPCDLITLGKAYDLAIKNVSQNWIQSELRYYPDILHRQSEEEYVLFVKKNNKSGFQEDELVTFLAFGLSLSEFIHCRSDWKKDTSSGTYMWIKKDKLEKVLGSLNIGS
jgi:hypothetical protein